MQYFIIENGAQAGPFSPEELVNTKNISAETLVWTEGLKDWTPAWQIEEIRQALENRINTQQTPPPVPEAIQNNTKEEKPQNEKKYHKAWWFILATIFVFLIILIASNPNKQDHKEAIKTEVTTAINKLADKDNDEDDLLTMGVKTLMRLFAGTTVDVTLDQILYYHNYLIYSSTDVTFDGEQHKVSYGILGHVFTFNADDVVRSYEDYSKTTNEASSTDNEEQTTNNIDSLKSNIDKTVSKEAGKLVDKVSKKVEDKLNKELDSKLDEVSDSAENVIDKIIKALGL